MNYYAGLDVSLEETSVCEGKALSEPAGHCFMFAAGWCELQTYWDRSGPAVSMALSGSSS